MTAITDTVRTSAVRTTHSWIPDHIESLEALHLKDDEYVIGGSAAVRLHQYTSTPNTDIDITIPHTVCDRLLREHRIRRKGDGSPGWESLDGHVDINTSETSILHMSWEAWKQDTVTVFGYSCLTSSALVTFYQRLAGITKKQKHVTMVERLGDAVRVS